MMTEEELKEIEDRLQAASPGPWTVGFNGSMRSGWAIQRAGTASVVINLEPEKNISLDMESHQVDGNLDFIQHSREDVERLVGEVRELKKAGGSASETGFGDSTELQLTVARLADQVEKMRAALYFYAHPETYKNKQADADGQVPEWIGTDLGRRARTFFTPAQPPSPAEGPESGA